MRKGFCMETIPQQRTSTYNAHIHTHTRIHMYIHTYMQIYINTHVHTRVNANIHSLMHTQLHIQFTHKYIQTCIYIQTQIIDIHKSIDHFIHTYIHASAHTISIKKLPLYSPAALVSAGPERSLSSTQCSTDSSTTTCSTSTVT